jgi:hypothetical protein
MREISWLASGCKKAVKSQTKFTVSWDIAPCSVVRVDWRFRGVYCIHHEEGAILRDCAVHYPRKLSYLCLPPLQLEISEIANGFQVRFQVLTAASTKFRFVFWYVLLCKIIVDRRYRGTCCLSHHGDVSLFPISDYIRDQGWANTRLTKPPASNDMLNLYMHAFIRAT